MTMATPANSWDALPVYGAGTPTPTGISKGMMHLDDLIIVDKQGILNQRKDAYSETGLLMSDAAAAYAVLALSGAY
jgi:hypothetical protein